MRYGGSILWFLLVGGIVVLAFMLPGIAAEKKKSKGPADANAAPADAAPTGKPLMAKISPKIVAHKLTPVKFVPFTLNDLKDPKSGKVPAATDVLSLPNGVKVAAEKCLTAINGLEKSLNSWGYSLRGNQQKVVVQELKFTQPKAQLKIAKSAATNQENPKAQALLASPLAEAKKEYLAAVKAYKTQAKAEAKEAKALAKAEAKETKAEAKVAKAEAKGAKADVQEAKAEVKEAKAELAKLEPRGAKSSGKESAQIARLPLPGGVNPIPLPERAGISKSFSGDFGDPSVFAAGVNGSLTMTAAEGGPDLSGQATATCSIFGNSETLMLATANVSAPSTGNLSANIKVTILGTDQVVLSQSQSGNWTKQGTFTQSLPNTLQVQYNSTIVVVPVSFTFGVTGSISMPYWVGLVPNQAMGYIIPDIQANATGQASAGVEVLDTGAIVGVEGNLTLLNNKLLAFGSAALGTDAGGTFLSYGTVSRDDLQALNGSLSGFLTLEAFGLSKTFTEQFFSFSGIQQTFAPLDSSGKQYLQAQIVPVAAKPAAKPNARTTNR